MTLVSPSLSFGARIKHYRRLAGLTQEQLAGRSGFSVSYISMIERGGRVPVPASAELLAAALALDAGEREALDAALRRAAGAAVEHGAKREVVREAKSGMSADGSAEVADGVRATRTEEPPPPIGGFLGALPDGPLVARGAELDTALAALDMALAGAGRLVTLAGEPGIGKTRLAQELALRARDRGALLITGRCFAERQAAAFAPIADALAALFAGAPAAIRDDVVRRWPAVLALLPEASSAAAPRNTGANGTSQGQRFMRELVGFAVAVAAVQPVALLLDDLHWADAASLDFMLCLARETRGAAVFILGTYRDQEVRHQPALRAMLLELVRDRIVERVAMRPLGAEDTGALIAEALGAEGVDHDVIDLVYRTTQGNPFFVREMVHTLVDRREIELQAGQWRHRAASASGELEVPESVRETLGQRLAGLSPLAQSVLREASVFGTMFTVGPLPRMGTHTESQVDAALEEALAAGLIRETDGLEYGFSHALTQRAIYTGIPAPRRRHLHVAAGEALERARPGERARRAAELAGHFLHGDDIERALPYVLLAGDQAARVYAHAEADQHFSHAIDLAGELGDSEREATARERRADMRYLLGRIEDARADAAAAVHIYRALGNWDRLAWVTCQLAKFYDGLGRVPETMIFMEGLLETLIDAARAAHPDAILSEPGADASKPDTLEARTARACAILSPSTAGRVYLCLTARLAHLGRWNDTLAFSIPAVARVRQSGEPRMVSLIYSFRAAAEHELGHLEDAVASLDVALRAADESGDLEARFQALTGLALIHQRRAAPRAARDALIQALAALNRLDDTMRRSALLGDLGQCTFTLGDWTRARAYWNEALAIERSADGTKQALAGGASLALLRQDTLEGAVPHTVSSLRDALVQSWEQGNPADAAHALETLAECVILTAGLADLRDLRDRIHEVCATIEGNASAPSRPTAELASGVAHLAGVDLAGCYVPLAWAHLLLGDLDVAELALERAHRVANARGNRVVMVDVWRVEALVAMRRERWDEAARLLDYALALTRAMPYPYGEAKALYAYGELHASRGEPDAVSARLEEAHAILARLGERLYAGRVERALAGLAAAVHPEPYSRG